MPPIKSRAKNARHLMEDITFAMQLQDFDDKGEARKSLQTQHRNNKWIANKLALENYQQTPLLKLPREVLNKIYGYVFDDQVLEVTMANGELYLVEATYAYPFGLPSACRMLYQDTSEFPYSKTTFKIFTFQFISLLDTWQYPILSHLDEFLDALNSIPVGVNVARFEIAGCMRGCEGPT